MNFKVIISIILFSGLSSCDYIKIKEEKTEPGQDQIQPVARVNDNYLYSEDLEGIVNPGISGQDSIDLVHRYINSWAKKQLLIDEAANQIEFNEAEIERKILDYRYALMVYEYQKQYINRVLDKEVTEEEIKEYYQNNLDKFELKQNIIRGIFIKLPKQAPDLNQVKKMIRSGKEEDKEELRSYCIRFATTYSLEDSVWLNFDEVIKQTPLVAVANKVQFLRENDFIESEDDEFKYFFRIDEYRISDQTSPLDFVEDQIRNIIINKRKVSLANELENEVFNEALNNNDFEIYQHN